MTQDTLPITPNKAQQPIVTGRSPRESTLESADQAAGIYSLYGDGSGARDSWLGPSVTNDRDQGAMARRISLPRTPLRNSITENELEEMEDEYSHQNVNGDGRDIDLSNGNISRSSTASQIPPPEIRLTPSKRQTSQEQAHHTNIARLSPSPRHPLGGSTTSNTSSMSTSRLSSAGSSQYPGEEEDAFHVRSTCESCHLPRGLADLARCTIRSYGCSW